jgi:uncharacterized protein YjiS (DUF1127 family)
MHKISEYDTSSLTTGLYERFDSNSSEIDVTTFTAVERYITEMLRRWNREYEIKRTVACLSKLDDRQLADIGLTFDKIPEAARRSVEKPDASTPRDTHFEYHSGQYHSGHTL